MIASRRFLAVVTIAVGATVGAFAAASAAPMSSMGAYSAGQASLATPVARGYWVYYNSRGYRYRKWCWYSYGRRYCNAPVRYYKRYRRRRYYY
jgi:hypothetical protein